MAHFATPLVNINLNTIDIVVAPCQFSPSPTRTHPSSSIPRKRMNRRPRILSFPAAVVAFCKSLRLPSATNRYPQHAARRTLVASPIQKAADLEVDDSVFVHKEHSEDTVDHARSLDADVASSSSSSELQARSKSPLSMISSPILEHWDSAALEVYGMHLGCAVPDTGWRMHQGHTVPDASEKGQPNRDLGESHHAMKGLEEGILRNIGIPS
ncbi:hypothetical protein FIBSPDRAFT_1039156 [Athelia psychrophila]|nr:hypothetical protein FIBSPDRAFT_1039156 [Fibularhizoctonia sp. CBS 109695]